MMEFIGYWFCASLGLAFCLIVSAFCAWFLRDVVKAAMSTMHFRQRTSYEWERSSDGGKVRVYFRGFRWKNWCLGLCSSEKIETDEEEE